MRRSEIQALVRRGLLAADAQDNEAAAKRAIYEKF
jgi:hypothetical protein